MKKTQYLTLFSFLFSLLLLISFNYFISIQDKDNGNTKVLGVTTQNIILPGTTSYETNPGIGWQYMPSSNNSFFPETTSYISRSSISWKLINPTDGNFDWSTIDNEITSVDSTDKQTSFRIYSMRGEGFGGDQLPEYVRSQGNMLTNYNGDLFVNYSNCTYQQEWGEFIQQVIQKYDGDPSIAFIDISGYGNFNEWNYDLNQNGTTFENNGLVNPTTVDGFARKRLVDIFLGGSNSNHQCEDENGTVVTRSYNYTGFQNTQLLMPYAGDRKSLSYAMGKSDNVGIRHDCLGSGISDWSDWNAEVTNWFSSRWQTAPVVYELCEQSGWNFSRAEETLKYSHGTLVHDNPSGSAPFENQSTVESLMNDVGYKFQLKNTSIPNTVSNQLEIPLDLTWENIGYSPAYESMGQDFEQRIIIKNSSNTEILNQALNINANTDPNNWMPAADLLTGNPTSYTTSITNEISLPINTPDGNYTMFVGIFDNRRNTFINLYNNTNNDNLIELTTFTYTNDETGVTPPPEEPVTDDITFRNVYRFWSASNQTHFYTASSEERDLVINNYPDYVWKYEGIAFQSVECSVPNSLPVYRFWSDANQTHFYTASLEERNLVINNYPDYVWKYEGIAYCHGSNLTFSGKKPVYRFWSETNESHFYTSSQEEKDIVVNDYPDNIWRLEGIAFYVK